MSRNERQIRSELIGPALAHAPWEREAQLRIGPGRVDLTRENMFQQAPANCADYLRADQYRV